MPTRVQRKRLVALILGIAVVVALGAFMISGDVGDPDIPDDDVAVVEDAPEGSITQDDYQAGLEQAAFNLNLKDVPPADDPQFEQVQQAALSNLIQTRWVRGEAQDRGIEVTDRDVEESEQQIIQQQLGGQKGYEDFIKSSPFDADDVSEVAELSVLSSRLQEEALPAEPPPVAVSDVEDYYEVHLDQFSQPESRDVRQIVTKDQADAERALALLQEDDSTESWEEVAKRYSIDAATSAQGGLRRGVVEGQSDPAVDSEIFSAPVDQVQGPVKGAQGFVVFEVVGINPAETTPLGDVEEQIRQTLQQGTQSQAAADFRDDFISKWTARTFCAEGFEVDLCANAPPLPDACPIDDDEERESAEGAALEQGCEAPVALRPAINPGTGAVFAGEQLVALPQGPLKPPSAAGELPPGVSPLGPSGAPVPPGGGAPPPPPPGG